MTEQHPITPPPELIRKWDKEAATVPMADQHYIAIQAARWGADQQLNADCEWLHRRCLISGAEELRAALAEPEPAEPKGREPVAADLEKEFRYWWKETYGSPYFGTVPLVAVLLWTECVLARWGHQPAPPADGEVAELVTELQSMATDADRRCRLSNAERLTRAAELLERQATACAICERERLHQSTRAADLEVERQAAPVPVPVNERLPGPEDCDAEGRCWLLTVEDEYPQWRLHSIQGAQSGGAMIWVPVDSSPGVLVDCFYTSHWLPATALPVPQGEVE